MHPLFLPPEPPARTPKPDLVERLLKLADFYHGPEERAQVALDLMADTGGFSLDANLNPITDLGYVVSVSGAERKIPLVSIGPADILFYRDQHRHALDQGFIFGGWADGGFAYLDLSRNFNDLDEALAFGRAHDQIAIWDNFNGQEVRLEHSAKTAASWNEDPMDKMRETEREFTETQRRLHQGGIIGSLGPYGWDSEGRVYYTVPANEKLPWGLYMEEPSPPQEVEDAMLAQGIEPHPMADIRRQWQALGL